MNKEQILKNSTLLTKIQECFSDYKVGLVVKENDNEKFNITFDGKRMLTIYNPELEKDLCMIESLPKAPGFTSHVLSDLLEIYLELLKVEITEHNEGVGVGIKKREEIGKWSKQKAEELLK